MEHGTDGRMVRMELKYCERCGGLLLRRVGEGVVYCGPCELSVRQLPARRVAVGRAREAVVGSGRKDEVVAEGGETGAGRIEPQRATERGMQQQRRQA